MGTGSAEGKRRIRGEMLALRAGRSRRWRASRSGVIARLAARLSPCRRARVLLAYCPVRGEVDPLPLVRAALRRGLTVAFPRMEGRRVSFRAVARLGDLRPGRHSIPEPPASARWVNPATADVILVPGVAFDHSGNRLGYGGGCYDAVLSRPRSGMAVGLAFDFQVLPVLPHAGHDVAVDCVVTESGPLFP